ncbi:MAG: hypothetical protein JWL66_1645 [Sphingomonadales bacterium]|nr:hypothetical protein [Sphingomonadales bacterium]
MFPSFRLALLSSAIVSQAWVAPAMAQPSEQQLSAADAATNSSNDIIVTAQKREQRLQDVPIPVTVLSASALTEGNKVNVKDFYTSVPGLSILPGNNGGSSGTSLAIRGLTTGGGNPTVGTVVDDVPFGSSTNLGGGGPVPEFDPSELAGIEVLRGPQGTLYGANSLGGLLKYVSVDQSTDALRGRIEVGGTSVKSGALGYSVRAALNVPVSETLAIRVSGVTRRDPGYIDNVQTGEQNVNRTNASGGRLSVLWRPSSDFSLKLNATLQRDKILGFPYTDSNLGDLQQSRLRGTGASKLSTQAYSALAHGKVGAFDLTSITGYSTYKYSGFRDFTFAFGPATQATFGVGGDRLANPADTKKFSQELRLSVPIIDGIDGLIGAFYTHEKSVLGTDLRAVDPATGADVAQVLQQPIRTNYDEIAAFGNLTFQITDKFNIQTGGRLSRIKQHYETVYNGPYNTIFLNRPDPFTPPQEDTKDNTFTYSVTPQYKFSQDAMVYARVASGYRPGGPNSNNSTDLLPSYAPDKTQNYELGFKGSVLDRKLSFDASIYYIEWKDIQLAVIDPVTRAQLFVNGSRAKSQGVELSMTAHPVQGLTISGWIAYNDAKLKRALPVGLAGTAVGGAGDRLPVSSRYSGKASVNDEFGLSDGLTGFAGADVSYVGKRLGNFQPAGVARQVFSGYAQLDLHAGLKQDMWTASVFLNNVTDKRGVLPSGTGDPIAVYVIQPRTIGINLSRTF